jgi:hypothetical protein
MCWWCGSTTWCPGRCGKEDTSRSTTSSGCWPKRAPPSSSSEGTTILKFFLHISKEEQKERLQARLDEPHKNWKFSKGDLAERALWDDYQKAYEDVLSKTSTEAAPWYVIPGDQKWFRNLLISQILVDTLEGLDMRFPEAEEGLDKIVIED